MRLFSCTYVAGINSSIIQHAFSYVHSVPSATQCEYKVSEEDTRPACSVNKDGEDAIASSGNNGDGLRNPSLVCF